MGYHHALWRTCTSRCVYNISYAFRLGEIVALSPFTVGKYFLYILIGEYQFAFRLFLYKFKSFLRTIMCNGDIVPACFYDA